MLSVEIKSKINMLWDKSWSRGIANPITAIEQLSYLLFLRRIDDTGLEEYLTALSIRGISINQHIEDLERNKFHDMNFLKIPFLKAVLQ